MKLIVSIFFIALQCICGDLFAQGCSDAGFCSAGALQSGHEDTSKKHKNSIALSSTFGMGEKETFIVIPQLELKYFVNATTAFEIKLPFYYANGNLGYHTGLGDILATLSFPVLKKNMLTLNGTAGLRISTGNASATYNNIALPMPYQSNLGTTDLILGVAANYSSWFTLAAGLQQPLIQYNKNQYFPTAQDDKTYFASRDLNRRGDILLRAEGHFSISKLNVSAGPLLIYHLGKDNARNYLGQQIILDGSEGLTLNIAGDISYTINRVKLDLAAGTPLVVRSYRPDGLTRSWVVTPRISWSF